MADESLTLTPPPVPILPQIPPEVARIIETQRIELEAVRQRETENHISATLASAINQHAGQLLDGTSGQVEALLRPHLRLSRSGSDTSVVGPKMEPIDAFVRDRLASREFSHFIKAQGVGGTANGQPAQHGPTPAPYGPAPGQPAPKNAGEAMVASVRAQQEALRAAGMANPTTNMSLPFGLGPVVQ